MSQKPKINAKASTPASKKPVLWPFLLIGCLIVFAACFIITYTLTQDDTELSGEDAEGFTADDKAHIYNDLQNLYEEPILYLCDQPVLTDTGDSSYFTVNYYVSVPSADDVTVYRYYKFIKGSSSYKAGTLLCQTVGVSTEYTKQDLFPDS